MPYVFTHMWILRNLTEDQGGGERGKKVTEREGGWVMGIEEGTCWDEHWVLYGNQFGNKFYIKKIKIVGSSVAQLVKHLA